MDTVNLPTPEDIAQLLAFLPLLEEGASAYLPAAPQEMSVASFDLLAGEPGYTQQVNEFIRLASAACWRDSEYQQNMTDTLSTPLGLQQASLEQIRTVLTWLARGERFCEGTWGEAWESGLIKTILLRLSELAKG